MIIYVIEDELNDDFLASEKDQEKKCKAIALTMRGQKESEVIWDRFLSNFLENLSLNYSLIGSQDTWDKEDLMRVTSMQEMLVNDDGALRYYHANNIELIKYYFLKDWKYVLNGTRIIIIEKNMEVDQRFLRLNEEEKRLHDCFIAEALITGDGVDLVIVFSASKMPQVQDNIINIVKNASKMTGLDLEF